MTVSSLAQVEEVDAMGVWKQDDGTEVITDPDTGEVIEDDGQ